MAQDRLVFGGGFTNSGDEVFRHDENVHGGLGRYVAKGDALVVFVDDVGGNLAGDDFLENGHDYFKMMPLPLAPLLIRKKWAWAKLTMSLLS